MAIDVAPGRYRTRASFSSRLTPTQYGLLLVAPVAVVLVAVVAYPVLYSLYLSLTKTNPLTGAKTFIGVANFTSVLSSSEFWHSVELTLYYVVCVTLIATLVALGVALLLRERFVGRAVLLALVVLPWSLSTYAAGVVWHYVYSPQTGLIAAVAEHLGFSAPNLLSTGSVIPALAIAHAWQFAPLGVYFLLASLEVIPEDLYKLAKVDGMGILQRFRNITLPSIRTPLAIYLVLVGGQAATAFDLIYFLTSGGPGESSRTLTYDIYIETFQNNNLGTGAAMSWILLVLVTVVTVFYYFMAMSMGRSRRRAA